LLIVFACWTAGQLAVTLLSARTLPRIDTPATGESDERHLPAVSIVVPARNESRSIRASIASFLAQDYPDWEVIVVDDQSTDDTGVILDEIARHEPRLRVVHNRALPAGWLGKPHALHLGAAAATYDWLLFVDADIRYAPGLLRAAMRGVNALRCDFLSLLPRVEMVGFWEQVLMPFLPGVFYGGVGVLANLDAVGRVAAGGGPGNLVTRRVYEAVGGHAQLATSIIDDVRLALLTKRAGYRTRVVRAEDLVSLRMYHGFREVVEGFTKNVSHLYYGWTGVGLFLMMIGLIASQTVPAGVLIAAAAGAAVSSSTLTLAGASVLLVLAARLVLQRLLDAPAWPAFTFPLQAVVWAGITLRSFYDRIVRNEVVWRGRRYDAGQAGF
jgi:chlorobactene glucosyltransferase